MNKMQGQKRIYGKSVLTLILCLFFSSLTQGQSENSADVMPKVFLNHFFIVIDSATYQDIKESDFLKNELAPFEERTTISNNNETWTGAYIYGENTYFEFFDSAKNLSLASRTSGIAFSVEHKGEFQVVQQKLKEYLNAPFAMRTREIEGKQVPWFRMTSVFYGKGDRDIITWVMEYHENYLKTVFPELTSDTTGVTRKEYLGLNAAKIAKPDQLKSKIFKDIIEMNLRLKKEDIEKFLGELKVYEYKIAQEGTQIICQGPDIKFVIEKFTEGKGGITAIKMSLRHDQYERKTYKFGEKMQLILHDNKTATWKFK